MTTSKLSAVECRIFIHVVQCVCVFSKFLDFVVIGNCDVWFLVQYVVTVWLLDDNWMILSLCCAADAESVSRSLLFFKCFVLI